MKQLSTKLVLISFLFLSSLFSVFAQTTVNPCGTDEVTAKRIKTDSIYRAFVQSVRPGMNKAAIDFTTTYTIPVVFVVYHLGEPTGSGSNVSDEVLQAQIALMNNMFAGTQPAYIGPDAKIRFALAQRTTSCSAFNGIVRVDARSVPDYASKGLDVGDGQMAQRLRALLPEYQNSTADKYVVVRVMHRITGAGGWAQYGGDITVSADGMNYLGQYNDLLSHEMGHVLFLRHTFEGSYPQGTTGTYSCPPNADPETEGDQVSDTDPHKIWEPSNACSNSSESDINSCTGLPFGKIGQNIMSYGCNKKMFTQGQILRMRSYLEDGLKSLVNNEFLTPPSPGEAVKSVACSLTVSTPTSGYGLGITQVQFQDILKKSRNVPYFDGHSQDYTCSNRTIVTAGQSYSISVSGYGNYRRVYIDYNNDGLFNETNELVLSREPSNYSEVSRGVITIPTNAVLNTYLRMRVLIDNSNTPPTACRLYGAMQPGTGSGEVEDYGVKILGDDAPQGLSLGSLASTNVCRGQQLSVPFLLTGPTGSLNRMTIQLSDITGSFTNPMNIGTGTVSPISATLPMSIPTGEGYRLRVVSLDPSLISDSGPILNVENLPTASLLTTSTTLTAGQTVTLAIGLTGRKPWSYLINRNGNEFVQINEASTTPQYYQFTPTYSGTYTIGNVSNGCGTGTTSGTAVISVPCSPPYSLTETQKTLTGFRMNWLGGDRDFLLQWKELTAENWTEQSVTSGGPSWGVYGSFSYGKTYVWRVKVICPDGESDWSPVRTVVMDCATPFNLVENITPSTARLSWFWTEANSQTIQWREKGNTDWISISAVTSNQYDLTNLETGKEYEWRVRSECPGNVSSDYSAIRSFTTQCGRPQLAGYNDLTASSIKWYWNPLPGISYQFRWRVAGASTWTESTTSITTSPYQITGLANNTTYEVQIRMICPADDASAYSFSRTFTTYCPTPTSPYLMSTLPTSVAVGWFGATDLGYEIRFRPVNTANWTTITPILTNRYSFTGLTTGITYEWQVQSLCSGSVVSGFTSSMTFTPSCLRATNLTELFIGPTSARMQITTEGGLSYILQWRAVGSVTWQSSSTLVATNSANYYFNTITGLTTATAYEWRVLTLCGGTPTASDSRTFTTGCGTPRPNGLGGVAATSIWVYWQGETGLIYQVRWREIGTSTWNETTPTITNTYYYLTGLVNNTNYEWQVRAICSATESSPYSTISSFATYCGQPYSQYKYSLSPTAMQIGWGGGSDAGYSVRYRPVNTSSWTIISPVTTSYYNLTGLTTGTTYEWQVQSLCSGSAVSGFTSSMTFTPSCLAATNLTELYIGSNSASMQITTQGGTTYILQWRAAGSVTWQSSSTLVAAYSADYTFNTITGLTTATAYEWRVLTLCGTTTTASDSRTFTTGCRAPRPSGIGGVAPTSTWVYWQGQTGLTYQVRWRQTGMSTWNETPPTITNAYYYLTGLVNNTAYEWQVRAICSATESSTYSAVSSFTTYCGQPYSQYNNSISSTVMQVGWGGGSDAGYSIRYRPVNTSSWTIISPVTTSYYNLTGLTIGTTYEWQVQSLCSGSAVSGFTTSMTFTPSCLLASGLAEVYIKPTSAQLQWNAQAGGSYILQWKIRGSETWQSSATLTSSFSGAIATAITSLSTGAVYEWRVMTNCGGVLTPSASRTFTAECTSPFTNGLSWYNATATTVYVIWTIGNSSSGILYRVRYRPVGSTAWTESAYTAGNELRIQGLINNTTYEWQVQTICNGQAVPYSANGPSFTTTCNMPGYASQRVSDLSAQLYWGDLGADIRYNLQYRLVGAPQWTRINSWTSASYSLTGLSPQTAYEWQVQTVCTDGSTSEFTRAGQFITLASCDPNEPNDTYQTATVIEGDTYTSPNLCLNLVSDNDWFKWTTNGKTYYILVHPYAYGTTGPYRLSLTLVNGVLTAETKSVSGITTESVTTDTYLKLYDSDGTTLLASNDDFGGTVWSRISYTLSTACSGMYTVKSGLWTDISVWSCNRLPTATDTIQISPGHIVTMPANATGYAKKIIYGTGSKVILESVTNLKTGF